MGWRAIHLGKYDSGLWVICRLMGGWLGGLLVMGFGQAREGFQASEG
jgi:hypothetical protein